MKKILLMMVLLVSVPLAFATSAGQGVGIGFETELFGPKLWMCDSRRVVDDNIQSGRVNVPGESLIERTQNYAFEGEQIIWEVLVMDKNKIEEIEEVVATVGSSQGEGNNAEVECARTGEVINPMECNARIDEEEIKKFDRQTMAYYRCILTVERPDSMYGEYWVTIEAIDKTGQTAIMDENEHWFFNPVVALSIDGDLDFGIVRPGTIAYSDSIIVGNDADEGSGVLMDMFISGTDFYDGSSSGARCSLTNRLKLGDNYAASGAGRGNNKCNIGFGDTDDHICYYAALGGYSTNNDPRKDNEGYVGIVYGKTFKKDFYNDAEIVQTSSMIGPYYLGNVLTTGAEMALTFKLGLPMPCNGDFTDGEISFWGEAI